MMISSALTSMPHFDCANSPHCIQILDETDCDEWVLQIMLLKRHWQQRHPLVPFYTLGMAAYLDCVSHDGEAAYTNADLRAHNNQLLLENFSPLLNLLCLTLQQQLALPVSLANDAALPGFHIYLSHPAFAEPVAKIHQDLQYKDVFPQLHVESVDLLSFTLSLSTPEGSGLHIWQDGQAIPSFFAYRNGQLILHHGLATHQAVLNCSKGVERVTLQGHAVRFDERWWLYW